MRQVLNDANPQILGKNHVCVSKLILNYVRSSGTQPRIKCDSTVCQKSFEACAHHQILLV
jgi:hypothetical protein